MPANVESLTPSKHHFVHRSLCTDPEAAQVIAYCILRACLGHASSTANFRRQLPSRAPSYFPFEIEPFHAIPHSCIHIPNMLLTP
jgi:hypothetical protein